MRNVFSPCYRYVFVLFLSLFVFSFIYWGWDGQFLRRGIVEAKITKETPFFDEKNPEIQGAMAVQNRHVSRLMAIPEVVGAATGLNEAGRPAVIVLVKNRVASGVVPESLEGIPVSIQVTGEIFSMKRFSSVHPGSRFATPVPIGVSTGNAGECSAGTIGSRVKDSAGNVYALSNNHVYALENAAPQGSQVLQPGLYDTNCVLNGNNVIGNLSAFVPIDFSSPNNTVDAAIAISSTLLLGNTTPSNGYGKPSSTIVGATIGQAVQKYGRTTSLTTGIITGINATVSVNYGASGTATFVNQIIVSSPGPFIKAGDSGSLVVTYDANCYPVGLLFAGNTSGTFATANQIGNVLSSLGVTIDGK